MTVSQVWLHHLSQTFRSHPVSHVANCGQDAMSVKLDPQTVSERLESKPRSLLENTLSLKFRTRVKVHWKVNGLCAPQWPFLETVKEVGDAGTRKKRKDGLDKERERAVKGAAVLDVVGFSQLGLAEPVRR